MGGIVVGNYDTRLLTGQTFIYNINTGTYYSLTRPVARQALRHMGFGIMVELATPLLVVTVQSTKVELMLDLLLIGILLLNKFRTLRP